MKFWLKEFPDWDLEARNTITGGIALGSCSLSPNRLELTTLLLKHGAKIDFTRYSSSNLSMPTWMQIEWLKLLLKSLQHQVNYRRRATTMKWKSIRMIAKTDRVMSNPGMLFSFNSTSRVLVKRGDLEIVEVRIVLYRLLQTHALSTHTIQILLK